jgi:Ca-activated chloride channel family protein
MNARITLLVIVGCLLSTPAFAGVWSNLWRTPDQQGEALLKAGRPAQAAKRFTSARRKAYADLEAGHYAQAAQLLQRFKDATSEYNRGNALAHLGHLHAALSAYDAALRQSPHDHDIRHNRALIERLLAHQPPQRRARPKSGSGAHQSSHGASSGASGPHNHNGSGHSESQAGSGRKRRTGGHHASGRSGSQAKGARAGQRSASARQSGARGSGPDTEQGGSPANSSAAESASHTRRAGQAKRDAALAAAIAHQGQHKGASAVARATPTDAAARAASPAPRPPAKPRSEKSLALKQWLRQIPNNPAGLLRRKFLIKYLLRHPQENP